jgi:hypothetical protein
MKSEAHISQLGDCRGTNRRNNFPSVIAQSVFERPHFVSRAEYSVKLAIHTAVRPLHGSRRPRLRVVAQRCWWKKTEAFSITQIADGTVLDL